MTCMTCHWLSCAAGLHGSASTYTKDYGEDASDPQERCVGCCKRVKPEAVASSKEEALQRLGHAHITLHNYDHDLSNLCCGPCRSAPGEKFMTRMSTTRDLAAGTTRNTNNLPVRWGGGMGPMTSSWSMGSHAGRVMTCCILY